MQLSSISFGKKIPIMQCKVQNRKTNNFVPSTIYEYDCKDPNDAKEIDKISDLWIFKPEFYHLAKDKFQFPQKHNNTKIYSLETSDGNILGLINFSNNENINNIDILETKPFSGHKYVGRLLIAAVAKRTLINGYKKLTVDHPMRTAVDYYTKECGFKETDGIPLEMDRLQMKKFIKESKEKTQT